RRVAGRVDDRRRHRDAVRSQQQGRARRALRRGHSLHRDRTRRCGDRRHHGPLARARAARVRPTRQKPAAEAVTTVTRTAAIATYFQAGKNVCPFAKTCPLELATVSMNPRADRSSILRSVTAFAAARGNALVLVAKADKGFAATATWAAESFLELMNCCLQINHPTY